MYTSHGHYIPGTGTEDASQRPAPDPCGGVDRCGQCKAETLKFTGIAVDASEVEDARSDEQIVSEAMRQSQRMYSDEELLNRFGYHKGTDVTIPIHAMIRQHYLAIASWLDMVLPPGRAKAMAFTQLEDSSMWANKAVAELAPVVKE